MLERLAAMKRSDRLRAAGWLVLAGGLVASAAFYWIERQTADPALSDATALGYTRSLDHEMGVMMGHFGLILTQWQTALASPAGEALTMAVCVALVAACFFRVAWVIDHDQD